VEEEHVGALVAEEDCRGRARRGGCGGVKGTGHRGRGSRGSRQLRRRSLRGQALGTGSEALTKGGRWSRGGGGGRFRPGMPASRRHTGG
jgi:hypothetical protein